MTDRDDFEVAYVDCLGDARFNGLNEYLRSCRVSDDAYLFDLPQLDQLNNMIATGCINAAWWAWRYQAGRFYIMQDKGAGHVVH